MPWLWLCVALAAWLWGVLLLVAWIATGDRHDRHGCPKCGTGSGCAKPGSIGDGEHGTTKARSASTSEHGTPTSHEASRLMPTELRRDSSFRWLCESRGLSGFPLGAAGPVETHSEGG